MSCYMVFSCASQLLMASVIQTYLRKALFTLGKADTPTSLLFMFLSEYSRSHKYLYYFLVALYIYLYFRQYTSWKFWLTSLIHLQLKQRWISVIMLIACITPKYPPLVSPLFSYVNIPLSCLHCSAM